MAIRLPLEATKVRLPLLWRKRGAIGIAMLAATMTACGQVQSGHWGRIPYRAAGAAHRPNRQMCRELRRLPGSATNLRFVGCPKGQRR